MDDTNTNIEEIQELRIQLARIVIATTNIRQVLDRLEERNATTNEDTTSTTNDDTTSTTNDDTAAADPLPPNRPTDCDGNIIVLGNRVTFLTRGKYNSTEGVATRFSIDNKIIFSLDNTGAEIARQTRNVRIVQPILFQNDL